MKTIKIGLPVAPAKNIDITEIKIVEILISYGGGMGGVNETFYAIGIKKKEKVTNIKNFDSREIVINNDFIVKTEAKKLVKVVTDTTAHTNHKNMKCNKSIVRCWYKVNSNENYEVFGKYFGNGGNAKSIYSELEIT